MKYIKEGTDFLDQLKDRVHDQYDEIQKINRQIKIKDQYLQAIINIGYDYDGYNQAENLKKLIDELVNLADRGIECDDKSVFYASEGKEYNILMEEIKEED